MNTIKITILAISFLACIANATKPKFSLICSDKMTVHPPANTCHALRTQSEIIAQELTTGKLSIEVNATSEHFIQAIPFINILAQKPELMVNEPSFMFHKMDVFRKLYNALNQTQQKNLKDTAHALKCHQLTILLVILTTNKSNL